MAPHVRLRRWRSIKNGILDRSWIDNHIEVPRVDHETLSNDRLGEPPPVIRERVEAARQIQRERSGWICQHVLQDKRAGGDLYRHLRCQNVYRKRYGHSDRRGSIPGARSIDERPVVAEQRLRLSDWEADTMSGRGRRGALLSLTKRKSRFTLLVHLSQQTALATER